MSTDDFVRSIDRLEPRQALATLDKAMASDDDDRLWYTRANLLYSAAWINRVLDGFAERVGLPKPDMRARAWLASEDGPAALADAMRCYDTALARNPQLAKIHYLQGRAHELAGDLEAARRSYERCLELAPRIPIAQWHLARLYERRGDEHAALAIYQTLYAQHPDFIDAKIAAANILRRNDSPILAGNLYASALTIPRAYFNARWRVMTHVALDERVPVEDYYKGYAIWFERDGFVATPAPQPAAAGGAPEAAPVLHRLASMMLGSLRPRLAPLIPVSIKVLLRSTFRRLVAAERYLFHPSARAARASMRQIRAKRLASLKTAIDRLSA